MSAQPAGGIVTAGIAGGNSKRIELTFALWERSVFP